MTTEILGQRWFRRLVPSPEGYSLLKEIPIEKLDGKVIVSMETDDDKRIYTYFDSFIGLARYLAQFPADLKRFHEIIPGENHQKAHFDLDIDYTNTPEMNQERGDLIREGLILSILKTLEEKGFQICLETDILIYNSSDSTKYSCHIVIGNYYHLNHLEARTFYQKCVERLPEEYRKYIDSGVYNSRQSFRLLGSHKNHSNRVKKFNKFWNFRDREITHRYKVEPEDANHESILQLEESLIGWTVGCKPLPLYGEYKRPNTIQDSIEISEAEAKDATLMLLGFLNLKPQEFPYRIRGIQGPFVSLERIHCSHCRLCNRVHDAENPYLMLTPNRQVYFYCRRAPKENNRFLVGTLNQSAAAVSADEINEPEDVGLSYIPSPPQTPEVVEIPEPPVKPKIDVLAVTKQLSKINMSQLKPKREKKVCSEEVFAKVVRSAIG